MDKIKKIIILFILLFSLNFAVADTINLGDFIIPVKQDSCFNIPNGCDNCSYMNITITYPNGTIIVSNAGMTSDDGFHYNYTFCNTSTLGRYWSTFHYDEDGIYLYTDMNWFEVTPTGSATTIPQAIMYGIILFILLTLFFGSFIWFNNIQWGHYTSSEGVILEVNRERTKKVALFFFAYITMLLLLLVGKSMAENFMIMNDVPVFFNVFFNILLVSIAPVTIAVTAIIILTTIADSKLQEGIFRGLEIR